MKLWPILSAVFLLIFALGCSADAESPDAPGPAGATRNGTPLALPTPPGTTAASGGVSVAMGVGSSCWSAAGSAACIDKIGPITGVQALTVGRGARIDVAHPMPGTQIREASVSAVEPSGQPQRIGNELAWPLPEAQGRALPSTVDAAGVHFDADLPAGRYVISVHVVLPPGSVSYGLLLEVR